jgi:general secretion pathway protein C
MVRCFMNSAMDIAGFVTHPRVRRWLPAAINGGMVLLLVASFAQWTWLMVKPPLAPLVIAPPPPPAPTSTFSLQPLLAAHLFGQASEDLAGQRLDSLPVSSLNLVLTGVIAADTGGYALISVNGQAQEPYAVGQSVKDGALLQAVYPDRVVIRRNGALESLLLEDTDSLSLPQVAQAPARPMPLSLVNGVPAAPAQETAGGAQDGSEEPVYMMPPEQASARPNPPDITQQATLMPARDGGVTVRLIQPGSVYEKLKMRSGDVIKSINGQQINSPQDAFRLYQQLPNMGLVQIEVVRGGRSEFLSHQFAQN